jgi:hypothetical protein
MSLQTQISSLATRIGQECKSLWTAVNGKVADTDSRLTDARTPTEHGNEKHSSTFITSGGVTYENLNANGDVGTGASQVAAGNDSRFTDNRTPTDDSVTYTKIANDLKSSSAISASAIDWSTAGVFTKTLSANTTFTFSNLQLNKVITLVLSGNYTVTMPSGVKVISGEYDGSTTNYIQLHCTNTSTPVVWCVISQEA